MVASMFMFMVARWLSMCVLGQSESYEIYVQVRGHALTMKHTCGAQQPCQWTSRARYRCMPVSACMRTHRTACSRVHTGASEYRASAARTPTMSRRFLQATVR